MILPAWMRAVLWATAAMNLPGAIIFASNAPFIREFLSLSFESNPLFRWILAEFIFIFGVAYAYCAHVGRAPRLFIAVAASGKFAFFATIAGFCVAGQLPMKTAFATGGDLIFGCLFVVWLLQTRGRKDG